MAMQVRVLIVCNVRLFRDGLRSSLHGAGSLHVVATSATADDALQNITALAPDVVLLDIGMPDAEALIPTLHERNPQVKVVALGISDEPEAVLACVEAGAAAFVAREASLEELITTLETAARGDVLCSPSIAGLLFRRVAILARERRPSLNVTALTDREREILALIEHGFSNKEIARRLRLQVSTVKNHVHHILEKLGVSRRGAAAALARFL
jgi:DNA-binding NarL/FixJ family response regulator